MHHIITNKFGYKFHRAFAADLKLIFSINHRVQNEKHLNMVTTVSKVMLQEICAYISVDQLIKELTKYLNTAVQNVSFCPLVIPIKKRWILTRHVASFLST